MNVNFKGNCQLAGRANQGLNCQPLRVNKNLNNAQTDKFVSSQKQNKNVSFGAKVKNFLKIK